MIRPERFRITPRARRGSGQPLLKQNSRFAQRRGFTLVELMVVIAIVLALSTVAITVAVPDVQTRRLREAARLINAFLIGASARAAETGRPVAVILEADASQPLMCRTLKYAEVPPPYAGDTLSSRLNVWVRGLTSGRISANDGDLNDSDEDFINIVASVNDTWTGLIKSGDLLKLNYQGHYYSLLRNSDWIIGEFRHYGAKDGNGKAIRTWRMNSDTTNSAVRTVSNGLPYQIFRQPVASASASLELPESVVVDLGQSGPNSGRFFKPADAASVAIVFSPGGSVLSYHIRGAVFPASGPIYLLVGKREQIETGENLGDFETFWIAVNNQTGLVTSVENAGVERGGGINESRDFARKAQSMGGR